MRPPVQSDWRWGSRPTEREVRAELRFPELEDNLATLEHSAASLQDTFESLLRAGPIPIYAHDFLIGQIAIRTRAVTLAFCSLLREDNEYVASMLIRINLEHVLLLQAGETHPDGSEGLVNGLMAGKQLRQIKDKSGKNMTGRYLSKRFDETGPYGYLDGCVVRVIPRIERSPIHNRRRLGLLFRTCPLRS